MNTQTGRSLVDELTAAVLQDMANDEAETPRRIRLDLFTPAEKAIYDAAMEVEKVGADVKLTDAVILLQQARSLVADYVDQTNLTEKENSMRLPSNLQPNQVCKLKFREDDNPITATVRGVHFYIGKVKYDLGLWLGDGTVDNPEYETRIYNVDSVFVTPA